MKHTLAISLRGRSPSPCRRHSCTLCEMLREGQERVRRNVFMLSYFNRDIVDGAATKLIPSIKGRPLAGFVPAYFILIGRLNQVSSWRRLLSCPGIPVSQVACAHRRGTNWIRRVCKAQCDRRSELRTLALTPWRVCKAQCLALLL